MFSQKFLISVALVAYCAIPASAALVTYCDVTLCSDPSTAFAGATSSDTFSNVAVTAGNLGVSYTDLDTGVEFSDPIGLIGSLTAPAGWPAGETISSNAGISTETITIPSSVSAIDFYVGMLAYDNFTISVTDSNGGTYTDGYFNQASNGSLAIPFFFGITTDGTFSSFTITSQGPPDQITLDGVAVGSSGAETATPEVTTLLLVGTGLFMMGYGRRWMQRRANQAASFLDRAASRIDQAASRGTVRTMSTGITPA
ncbi:MAG TPA: hypothetical protein VGG72_00635 [Bryobacteraceae bacterium]|jgi:hypothetical protein